MDSQLDFIIDDLKKLILEHGTVSRDFYRANGNFTDQAWSKHFPTFKAFLDAANKRILEESEQPAPVASQVIIEFPDPSYVEPDEPEPELGYLYAPDTLEISLPRTNIIDLDDLLEQCKVDLSLWSVKRFFITGKDAKATLVKRREIVDARREIEKLKAELKKGAPFVESLHIVEHPTGNVLEINIADHHFGKLAWGQETGGKDYDTKIASATFERAVKVIVSRAIAGGIKFDKILFVVGNDLFNSDNEQGTTTKGTHVSTDGRYKKTFVTVRQTITWAINYMKQVAPVHVVMVSGNHDDLSVWHLGDSLECMFANDQNVFVDNSPTTRKYFRYEDVFLMFCHGDKGKRENYPLLMATERPVDFGETKFREVHTGHIHQTKLQEWHGVRVRTLPSLSPPDEWHSENGFIGQQRVAEAYIWNGWEGLVGMVFYNDDAYPTITTDCEVKEG